MTVTWTDEGEDAEIPLLGGDVTEGVVRAGGTVRKPVGEHSPLVHALLTHLEIVGFDGAPRFLGIDARGREVLTFIEGEVASSKPRPPWIADEGRLRSLARLVRAYDDAAASFVPPSGVEPALPAEPPGIPPVPPYPPELIGHVDITPENVVFTADGAAKALIDFDLAKPATRVDEIFNLMMWWAPLSDPGDADPLLRDVDVPRRCRLIADAYGMSQADRGRLTEVAIMRTRRSWHLMRHAAQTRGGGWKRMWDEGAGDVINRRLAWLERNSAAIQAALSP